MKGRFPGHDAFSTDQGSKLFACLLRRSMFSCVCDDSSEQLNTGPVTALELGLGVTEEARVGAECRLLVAVVPTVVASVTNQLESHTSAIGTGERLPSEY